MYAIWFNLVALLTWIAVSLGLIIPGLVSASDSFLVMSGYLYMVLIPAIGFWWINKLYKQANGLIKKE